MITLASVSKSFQDGRGSLTVIKDVSLNIEAGDYLSICGRSGCGKSTLLNLIALLLQPTSGEVLIDGHATSSLSDEARVRLRGLNMGMVFQNPNLIDSLSPVDNIALAIREKMPSHARTKRAVELLESVGLAEYARSKTRSLSGGQAQRVAICRAIVGRPRLVLCDEPTGALDKDAAEAVMALLEELREQVGSALVVVTHDAQLWGRAARCYEMDDGSLISKGEAVSVSGRGGSHATF